MSQVYYGGESGTRSITKSLRTQDITVTIDSQGSTSSEGVQSISINSGNTQSNTTTGTVDIPGLGGIDGNTATLKVESTPMISDEAAMEKVSESINNLVNQGVNVNHDVSVGGGCDAGFGALSLAFAALFLLRRKS